MPKKRIPRIGDIVRIEWNDAYQTFSEVPKSSFTTDPNVKEAYAPMTAIGFLTRKTREGVWVSAEDTGDGWRSHVVIPRSLVQGIEVLVEAENEDEE